MNNYTIIFSSASLIDVKEASAWYNLQQKGLGKKFKEEIKKTIASILLNPFFASVKYEKIRTASCKNFPYSIHYEISEDEKIVRIVSVFHFNRKPYWLKNE